MSIMCIMFAMAVLSQNATETMEFRHAGETHFGTVTEQAGGQMVRFVEDAPWKDNPIDRSFRADQVEYFPESRSHRERRHAEGWESRGFVNAAREGGDALWVPRDDADRAKRAFAMLEALDLPDETALPSPAAVSAAEAPGDSSGSAADYWPHAALVVVGLALLGIVTRVLILPA